ncbi:hypothetical protein [Natronococcus sp.]|uniref:DUF7344 domain-containing protein n=1 Tax=Natronococcus sp. TaxID=35747 RepID=UPI003A4E350E
MSRTEPTTVGPDVLWQLLTDPHRRYLLEQLCTDERTTLSNLAHEIAARNRKVSSEETAPSCRRRIEIALAHDHLPRLADCGVIAYDPSTWQVVLTADSETRRLLEAVLESDAAVR